MPLLRTLMRTTIATTLLREARKPKNQEKAKQLFAQAKDKVTGSGASRDAGGDRGSRGSTR